MSNIYRCNSRITIFAMRNRIICMASAWQNRHGLIRRRVDEAVAGGWILIRFCGATLGSSNPSLSARAHQKLGRLKGVFANACFAIPHFAPQVLADGSNEFFPAKKIVPGILCRHPAVGK
jgi:hypothetical protein